MRWLVGDVQGCARELELLLKRIRFDAAHDELWFLGDLVNRGPDSLAVLRLWRDLGARTILGNHDIYAIRALAGTTPRKRDTLRKLFDAPDATELLQHLRDSPVLVHLPADSERVSDVWIVHAGLHPDWVDLEATASTINAAPHDDDWLDSEAVRFATRVRCCTRDGELNRFTGDPSDCRSPYRPWDELYEGPALVVHGHWAQRGYYRGRNTMGLDSGCVYGGSLTAWCQQEDRLVQVASLRA